MARGLTIAQAKAKRQKKIAIGGTVVLVLALAIQLPKTLKMLHPKSPTTAATAVVGSTGTTPSGAPSVTVSTGGTSVTASVSLPESEQPPTAGDGQLVSFERFASKDPFSQQVAISVAPATGVGAIDSGAVTVPADGAAGGSKPAGSGDTGFTTGTGKDTGATTTAAPPAVATTLSINDEPEAVATAADFPAADPIFTLVKLGKDGKSVQIGIAGGTLSTGHDTVTLELGKPVTLMNTADGTRYTIVLLTVQGF